MKALWHSPMVPGLARSSLARWRALRETVLLIPVPEADDLLRPWLTRFDPSSRAGIPAHVTLIHPFLSPARIDANVVAKLTRIFSTTVRFRFQLTGVGGFPGVVYLAPEPVEPFLALIRLLVQAFPETPPYGGQFANIVPHLSVARLTPPAVLDDVAREVAHVVPIDVDADRVLLMRAGARAWTVSREFKLGEADSDAPRYSERSTQRRTLVVGARD